MANETLRYIKLDYQSHKDALLQRIRERWPHRWNDFLANSVGIVLVDVVAWGLATLAFLVNRVASENFIPTMSLRESAVRIGALTGYQLRGPTPSTVACEAMLAAAEDYAVIIYGGTMIRSADVSALPFEVVQDYTIPAGSLSPQRLVATFSPILSGNGVINTYLQMETGSSLATPLDSTIDLSGYIEAGQTLFERGQMGPLDQRFTISSLTSAPGGISPYSQIVLNSPWTGATERIEAVIYEERIQIIQGQTVTDRFVAPSNTVSYAVKLSQTPVIDNSVKVTVNDIPWNQTSTVGIADAYAQVFQLKTFISGETAIVFGDGAFGALVPPEAAVTVVYRIGGGLAGNVDLGGINTTITGIVSTPSNPVTISVTNSTSVGMGGQNAETLNQARVSIPYYTRTNDRAVTLADYQTMAQQYTSAQYGSVTYARSVVRTENALLESNIVSIYAWTTGPEGGLVPLSGQLKTEVRDYIQAKAVGTDYVQMLTGTARPVPLSLCFKVLQGFSIAEIKSLVMSTIYDAVTVLRPGDPLIYSDLVSALDSIFGVDNILMATPMTNLYPTNSTELFTVPQDSFVYTLDKSSIGAVDVVDGKASRYSVQFPVFPLQSWSFTMMLGINPVSILPFIVQDADGRVLVQQGRLQGANISVDDKYPSTVNLLTGQATVYVIGAPGDLRLRLITVQGYSAERVVNLYIGYQGELSQAKRREIRAALQTWGQGFGIGSSIYASRVEGISASVASVTDMMLTIPGVDTVNRVALDTPANSEVRVTAADFELLRVGLIILNNNVD